MQNHDKPLPKTLRQGSVAQCLKGENWSLGRLVMREIIKREIGTTGNLEMQNCYFGTDMVKPGSVAARNDPGRNHLAKIMHFCLKISALKSHTNIFNMKFLSREQFNINNFYHLLYFLCRKLSSKRPLYMNWNAISQGIV